MVTVLLLLAQVAVELPELKTSYRVTAPAAYSDRASWPVIVDLNLGKDALREPEAFVLAPGDKRDEATVLACVADLKTKYRVHPEKVVVRGGAAALSIAVAHPGIFSGCVLYRPLAFEPVRKLPPCVVVVAPADRDRL